MSASVIVLTGGVGGAKLVYGLHNLLPRGDLCAIVNTGDDFTHLGLHVSPDVDTLLYTLADLAHPEQGWGRKDESWHFMETLGSLGGDQWFRLGDRDLALHVMRTEALRGGEPLSGVTDAFACSWKLGTKIVPMTDDRVSTIVDTDQGSLPFQQYFVKLACRPSVRDIRFEGAATAAPAPGLIGAIADSNVRAIFIAPSNPFLSIDPILAVPGIRQALSVAPAPVVALSPLVGGRAVKGPTAKIMEELGLPISATAIADHYSDFLDAMIVDERDPLAAFNVPVRRADTLMTAQSDRLRVAGAMLEFVDSLRR